MYGFKNNNRIFKITYALVAALFFSNTPGILQPETVWAQQTANIPQPVAGILDNQAAGSSPVIRGLRFEPDNPLNIEFLIDPAGQAQVPQEESNRLIRYFLAGLTIPEEQLWVNLSPQEKDRIMPDVLKATDLGNDLLRQDYGLKQLSSALTYPDTPAGEDYWRVIREAIPDQTAAIASFSKLWIVPDSAAVYEHGNTVLVTEAKLKTMLDLDHKALVQAHGDAETSNITTRIARQKILPIVNNDVNQSRCFAPLRQIYHSIILAQWFKKKLKESFYKAYIDKGKVSGINNADPSIKEKIFQHYVKSFTQGLFDYTRPEQEGLQLINRRYYSGGIQPAAGLDQKIKQAKPQEAQRLTGLRLIAVKVKMLLLPAVLTAALNTPVGFVAPHSITDTTQTIAVARVNPDKVDAGYGGVSFQNQDIKQQGQTTNFNLENSPTPDFSGLSFEEIERSVVRVGDL